MRTNNQPNEDPDVEQYFPGEEPFSRKKRERQRQVALYLTLIVGAALLVVGVTLRYTVLAEAYKPDPYQPPPTVASSASEEPEEPVATPEPVQISARSTGVSTSALSGKIRETYFSDAPDSMNTLTAPATPTPAATPASLLPNTVDTAGRTVEPVATGTVVSPIETSSPISQNVTPSIRLFELPDRTKTEVPKLPTTSEIVAKTGAKATPAPSGGLKVNIAAPNITTLPGMLPPPGSKPVQPSTALPSGQPDTPPAPASESNPAP